MNYARNGENNSNTSINYYLWWLGIKMKILSEINER